MDNKNNEKAISAYALLALLSASSAHAVQQIEYADMKRAGANPVIVVTGKGDTYTDASSNKLTFHAEAKGRCTWANRYSYVVESLDKPNHQPQHSGDHLAKNVIVSSEAGYKNKNRTWSSAMKAISINWTPDKAARDAAVNSCNTKRASLIQSGNPPQGSFQGTALTDQVEHRFLFECSTLVSLTPNQDKIIRVAHPISVQCEKLTPISTEPTLPPAQQASMQIKHVAVVADPKNYNGMCPAKMTFKGTINTEGPGGEVQYRFLANGKPISDFKTKNIAAGKRSTQVLLTESLESAATPQALPEKSKGVMAQNQGGMQAQIPMGMMPTEKVTLQVKRGNQIRTAEDSYTIKCQQLKVASFVPAAPVSPAGKPDLTSRQGITLGKKSSSWGGQLILNQSDFTQTTPRGCFARFRYDVVNIGSADATGFNSRLRLSGKQPHTENNMALTKNQSKNVSGSILLPAGSYPVTASIDDGKAINESNENNNTFKVMVTVPESCGGGNTPRPTTGSASPTPTLPGTPPTSVPPASIPNPTGAVPMPRPTGTVPTTRPRPTSSMPTTAPSPRQ